MVYEVVIPLLFGVVLALGHHMSDKIKLRNPNHRNKMLSFTAGVSISYLFLFLFPEMYGRTEIMSKTLFIFVLLGFSMFHLIEKHAYKQKSIEKCRKELKEIHSASFFMYHFIIGILLVNLTNLGLIEGLLLFFPIFFHTVFSVTSLTEIHDHIKIRGMLKNVLAVSTLLGVVVAFFLPLTPGIISILLGFVVGALLYVIIRDTLPSNNAGDPRYFISGIASYIVLLALVSL
ncbi:hypothetical protein ACFLQN_03700 [Candidatus Aenigmatarchaeota archaeon]